MIGIYFGGEDKPLSTQVCLHPRALHEVEGGSYFFGGYESSPFSFSLVDLLKRVGVHFLSRISKPTVHRWDETWENRYSHQHIKVNELLNLPDTETK
jgi:hypothetical protein